MADRDPGVLAILKGLLLHLHYPTGLYTVERYFRAFG